MAAPGRVASCPAREQRLPRRSRSASTSTRPRRCRRSVRASPTAVRRQRDRRLWLQGPNCFCADAPPFDHTGKACFDQLVNYQVNAGKTFLVAGSQAGFVTTANTLPPSGICDPNPTPDPRFSFRIPMNAADLHQRRPAASRRSTAASIPTLRRRASARRRDDTPDAGERRDLDAGARRSLSLHGWAGRRRSGRRGVGGRWRRRRRRDRTHVRALFQNSQLSFVLANVDRAPTLPVRHQLRRSRRVRRAGRPGSDHGRGLDAGANRPRPGRLAGAGDDREPRRPRTRRPTSSSSTSIGSDASRVGGRRAVSSCASIRSATRSTVGSTPTGYQPIFEDYNASGGLFPIQ